jgi:hypothetical protein
LDSDPAEAAQTRRQILEQVAVEKTMMLSSHFSFPVWGMLQNMGSRTNGNL